MHYIHISQTNVQHRVISVFWLIAINYARAGHERIIYIKTCTRIHTNPFLKDDLFEIHNSCDFKTEIDGFALPLGI